MGVVPDLGQSPKNLGSPSLNISNLLFLKLLTCPHQVAKEDALRIWDLVRPHFNNRGRPKLLVQHEILPFEVEQQQQQLPFEVEEQQQLPFFEVEEQQQLPFHFSGKRSKEVVVPVRQLQSNQPAMRVGQKLQSRQIGSNLSDRISIESLDRPGFTPMNRVVVKKRFSRFRELQRMNQLTKREEQTQTLERPGGEPSTFTGTKKKTKILKHI